MEESYDFWNESFFENEFTDVRTAEFKPENLVHHQDIFLPNLDYPLPHKWLSRLSKKVIALRGATCYHMTTTTVNKAVMTPCDAIFFKSIINWHILLFMEGSLKMPAERGVDGGDERGDGVEWKFAKGVCMEWMDLLMTDLYNL